MDGKTYGLEGETLRQPPYAKARFDVQVVWRRGIPDIYQVTAEAAAVQ